MVTEAAQLILKQVRLELGYVEAKIEKVRSLCMLNPAAVDLVLMEEAADLLPKFREHADVLIWAADQNGEWDATVRHRFNRLKHVAEEIVATIDLATK